MSIERSDNSGVPVRLPVDSGRGAQRGDDANAPADRVEVTPRARELQAIREALGVAPDIRQERVDAAREQLSLGTYTPDDREVARQLLAFERLFRTS